AEALSLVSPSVTSLELHGAARAEIAGAEAWIVRTGGRSVEHPDGGFDVIVESQASNDVWARLREDVERAGGSPVGFAALEALRIEHGVARYGLDWTVENLPGEVGWDHALRFDRCYVGQEVVARMRTYGSASRKLVRLALDSGELPPAGTLVLGDGDVGDAGEDESEGNVAGDVEAGRVTSSARFQARENGLPLALALVKRRFLGQEKLRLALGDATVSSSVS